jgi:DNA-directed RNA polymerase specialized sigma24 family protein
MQEGLVEMTITEAATHLGITAEAVRKRIYRGDLEDRKRAG